MGGTWGPDPSSKKILHENLFLKNNFSFKTFSEALICSFNYSSIVRINNTRKRKKTHFGPPK